MSKKSYGNSQNRTSKEFWSMSKNKNGILKVSLMGFSEGIDYFYKKPFGCKLYFNGMAFNRINI